MKWNFLYQITAASRTPDKGATAPRSPSSLSSVLNWICWTPPKKIPGYATDTSVFQIASFHKIFGSEIFITFILSTDTAQFPDSIISTYLEELEVVQICWQCRKLSMTWQNSWLASSRVSCKVTNAPQYIRIRSCVFPLEGNLERRIPSCILGNYVLTCIFVS